MLDTILVVFAEHYNMLFFLMLIFQKVIKDRYEMSHMSTVDMTDILKELECLNGSEVFSPTSLATMTKKAINTAMKFKVYFLGNKDSCR